MKLKDILYFVFRDLLGNKMRFLFLSVETIIITLISIILLNSSYSYIKNSSNIVSSYYSNQDVEIVTVTTNAGFGSRFEYIRDVLEEEKEYIKYPEIRVNNNDNILAIDMLFFDNIPLELIDSTENSCMQAIYLKESFKDDYEKINNIVLEKYMNYDFDLYMRTKNGYTLNKVNLKYCGYYTNDYKYDIVCDCWSLSGLFSNAFEIHTNVTKSNFYKAVKGIEKVTSTIKESEEIFLTNSGYDDFYININQKIVDDYNKMTFSNTILIIATIFIIIILAVISLLCVYSVVNIIIDESSYIMSIYKAYGMKRKDFQKIYVFEMIGILFLSILVSSVLSLLLKDITAPFIELFLKGNYKSMIYYLEITPKNFYIFYVPLIVFLVYILFSAIIFSKKLKKNYSKIRIDGGQV
ncbi:MAG: FtsX-like permease family protein [Anaeroplasmataceae bacterium]